MRAFIDSLLRFRPLMVVALCAWIAAGGYFFSRLDIEAYPDPSPPLVEVITQNPAWSAEEIERQVTVPDRNRALRHPAPHLRSLDFHLRPERRKTLFQLRQRLFLGPPGSPQSPAARHAPIQRLAAALARIAHRRNLPLSARRPRLFAQRAQGHAGLVRHARNQAGLRHHRRRLLRRHHARISRRSRSRQAFAVQRHASADRQFDPVEQCECRRQLSHHGQPERQRPRPRPPADHSRNAAGAHHGAQWRSRLSQRCRRRSRKLRAAPRAGRRRS